MAKWIILIYRPNEFFFFSVCPRLVGGRAVSTQTCDLLQDRRCSHVLSLGSQNVVGSWCSWKSGQNSTISAAKTAVGLYLHGAGTISISILHQIFGIRNNKIHHKSQSLVCTYAIGYHSNVFLIRQFPKIIRLFRSDSLVLCILIDFC